MRYILFEERRIFFNFEINNRFILARKFDIDRMGLACPYAIYSLPISVSNSPPRLLVSIGGLLVYQTYQIKTLNKLSSIDHIDKSILS